MLKSSGIGTYIKNVIPGLLDHFDITLIGNRSEIINSFGEGNYRIIDFNSAIFTLKEQLTLPFIIPFCDIFWSPHYNSPIFPTKAKKAIITLHDANYFNFWSELHFLKKVFLKISTSIVYTSKKSRILTVSEFSRRELSKYLKIPPNKINVVFNGVLSDFSDGSSKSTSHLNYILFVGNVKPHKNLVTALEAFKILSPLYPSLKFVIVGKKEGFINGVKNLEEILIDSNDNIVFTGYLSENELKNYYRNAHAFIFPSLYEGFGIPILEAMTFKLPIVASKIEPFIEIAQDSIVYFDPLNKNDIAEKLRIVLDPEYQIDKISYEQIIERFKWDHVIEHHKSVFNKII